MAKAKGGLGRGLNSLLGSSTESALPQEKASPVERVKVDAKEDAAPKREMVREERPKKVQTPPPVSPQRKVEGKEAEDVYSSKIDNITIKGVVERETRQEKPERKTELVTTPVSAGKKEEKKDEPVNEIDIELIKPNPNQPRTNFKQEELEELASSIKKNGLLSPILVREVNGEYQIIAGERRWQACKSIGMKKVPVYIRKANDDETIMLALIENIQRSDLNPIEEAYGYRRMMERGGMTQSEVALAVSKGRSTIANALRLLELPEEAQQLLFEEKITAGHARAILSIPTKEGKLKLTEKLMNEQLSVRETEAIARLLSGKKEKKDSEPKPPAPKSYKTVARTLRDTLETNVRVKSVKGKNKIEIEFKDEADLQRLFRLIAKPAE